MADLDMLMGGEKGAGEKQCDGEVVCVVTSLRVGTRRRVHAGIARQQGG